LVLSEFFSFAFLLLSAANEKCKKFLEQEWKSPAYFWGNLFSFGLGFLICFECFA